LHPEGMPALTYMPSTYLSLHCHIVFGTKNREPTIATSWRSRLHEYLGGTIRGLGAYAEIVGGVADHVHLLVGLKATHCLSDVLRELKKGSSGWVHDEIGVSAFAWQEGYAAFSVSATARDVVRQYIANQAEHHRIKPFREELIEMLNKAGVAYDAKYLD
jgi:putative transposase